MSFSVLRSCCLRWCLIWFAIYHRLTCTAPSPFQSGFGERDCVVIGPGTTRLPSGECNHPFKWRWVKSSKIHTRDTKVRDRLEAVIIRKFILNTCSLVFARSNNSIPFMDHLLSLPLHKSAVLVHNFVNLERTQSIMTSWVLDLDPDE